MGKSKAQPNVFISVIYVLMPVFERVSGGYGRICLIVFMCTEYMYFTYEIGKVLNEYIPILLYLNELRL